jgi:protein gp37
MAEKTNISFAHHTGSPWIGCTKVNDDCLNCYADWIDEKRFSKTLGGATKENPQRHWGKGKPRVKTVGFWKDAWKRNRDPWICPNGNKPMPGAPGGHGPYSADVENFPRPCCECGAMLERARMFPSLCDWLDDEVPIEWLADFLILLWECDNLTWMLFTKRPENFFQRLKDVLESDGWWQDGCSKEAFADWVLKWLNGSPPQHVWIFASAGNQKNADVMIPELITIPARVHGVSCEPMTGPVDFSKWVFDGGDLIDVVIFGGESDQERPARPCNMQWIADGVKQCRDAGVLPYVKQLGSHVICDNVNLFEWPEDTGPELADSKQTEGFASGRVMLAHKSGADMKEWPDDLQVQELPKAH